MKAVIGSWDNRPYRLLAEVAALRNKVAELEGVRDELEAEVRLLRAENEALRSTGVRAEEIEVVLSRG